MRKTGLGYLQDLTKQVGETSKEVANTSKGFKSTWQKDTSGNIKYEQIPDYRSRQEVSISKKQKLTVENGEFTNLSWEPVTNFHAQVFPSFIIAWASYTGEKDVDMGSSLGFKIKSNVSGVVLKWEIESADKSYFKIDSGYITCKGSGETLNFMPKVAWDFRQLGKHQTSAPMDIYFRLIDPVTGARVEKLVTATLRSINDCITLYDNQSYNFMFAAYVNEEHPLIDKILKEALDTKMISSVMGYQGFNRGHALSSAERVDAMNSVDLQVAAVWRVLHDRGFKYSSITDNSAARQDNYIFSQTVRTFDNAMNTSQANCVDGTVLMASILKRMGLRPVLVLVPSHCFLGYYLDVDSDDETGLTFLETTMLSSSGMIEHPKDAILKNKKLIDEYTPVGAKLSDINKCYYAQFLLAKFKGIENYKLNRQLASENKSLIELVDVQQYRKMIAPIPIYN
ncbi:hypothetical protein [[Flexibacter] sp. ATCC 35208]|uniref:hypothetical protein n=1 Tax=[Flexibacter] sp. ATCC 35208 TaxID=1936242 RepID=UPI00117CB4BB|nr:hypothetical protein [[Flexibacter] sp. ATCC 35208]